MKTLKRTVCAVLVTLAGASAANADSDSERFLDRYGFGVTVGGGVSGFTGDTMRGTTDDGGNWDVRATLGTRSILGVEASYLGSAQAIDALGMETDTVLVGNGVQGNLRLNATISSAVQPFLYGGVAWRRYDLTGTARNTSDILDKDDVLEIPVGVGIAWKFAGLTLDARAEFRGATGEDLVPAAIPDSSSDAAAMHRYGVNANLGFEW